MASFLNPRIGGKAVIIQDELKRQRAAIDGEDESCETDRQYE
jgi:hypothetical protein